MAHKNLELEVEASNIRIKFPKISLAALSIPFVLLLPIAFNPASDPNPETAAPIPIEQPELTIEPAPVTTTKPKRAEPVAPDDVSTDNASPAVEPVAPNTPISADGFISGSCKDLNNMGLGNFQSGDPNYSDRRDRDQDGWACEF